MATSRLSTAFESVMTRVNRLWKQSSRQRRLVGVNRVDKL